MGFLSQNVLQQSKIKDLCTPSLPIALFASKNQICRGSLQSWLDGAELDCQEGDTTAPRDAKDMQANICSKRSWAIHAHVLKCKNRSLWSPSTNLGDSASMACAALIWGPKQLQHVGPCPTRTTYGRQTGLWTGCCSPCCIIPCIPHTKAASDTFFHWSVLSGKVSGHKVKPLVGALHKKDQASPGR